MPKLYRIGQIVPSSNTTMETEIPAMLLARQSNIRNEGYDVVDYRALEIADNLEVGRHDPDRLPAIVAQMDTTNVDAIVLSACVQMPSLSAVAKSKRSRASRSSRRRSRPPIRC
jgi:maleate cis-trans isomerase